MSYINTPRPIKALMNIPARIICMSDYGLLARRPNGAPTMLLQGLVSPVSRDAVRSASKASGVKISYYLDALIGKLVTENGGMPLVGPIHTDRSDQIDAALESLFEPDSEITTTVLLQGRVSPQSHAAVYDAIEASGVKKTYYLEGLIKQLIAENGSMPLVDSPRRDRSNQIEAIRNFPEVTRSSAA